ncbi:MAG: hypothetical protein PHU06_09365 [Gallionella sp.]|nr:hypothetical protein [Gallionella sp.]MDD4959582.1 hypothetical protein [Gallionella sp.]
MKPIVLCCLLCMTHTVFAEEATLGRLFFTPAQRAQRDARHISPPVVSQVNGIVQRDGGVRTVWINGVAQRDKVGGLPVSAAKPPIAHQAPPATRPIVIQKHER